MVSKISIRFFNSYVKNSVEKSGIDFRNLDKISTNTSLHTDVCEGGELNHEGHEGKKQTAAEKGRSRQLMARARSLRHKVFLRMLLNFDHAHEAPASSAQNVRGLNVEDPGVPWADR